MNKSMVQFNNNLFKKNHKSYYNKNDIEILNVYRTIVPIGKLRDIAEEQLRELDIRKAFTHAISQIKEIPVFTMFGISNPYTNEAIKPLASYIVKVVEGILFEMEIISLYMVSF